MILCGTGAKHGEGNKHDYAPDHITRWMFRRDKLVEELQGLNADIYCLQEVTERGLRETFIPTLETMGLTCAGFAPARDDRHVTSSTELSRNSLDHYALGCAIFCNPNVAEVVSSKRVFLKDFALGKNCRSADFHMQVMQKLNTIVMVLLKLVGTEQCVVVANTHLFWDPSRDDIKAIQAFAATEALTRFSSVLGYTPSKPPPLILCGDFNAMPTRSGKENSTPEVDGTPKEDETSAIFELLTSGELSSAHPQHPDQWYTRVPSAPICPRLGPLLSQWKLQNTFRIPEFAPYAPAFTTKTNDFAGWIDHIWVNDQITVTHSLVPPVCDATGQSSSDFPPIPNSVSPHLSHLISLPLRDWHFFSLHSSLPQITSLWE
jgi:CCR4-NOT transcription complex subunit 6